jgi:poly(A) polymerase
MPIITPAYPQQNSTYNVTYSTRAIMIEEIRRSYDITQEIFEGHGDWNKLFDPLNFFQRYKHFIVLIASTPVKDQYMDWVRLVESKIRHLVLGLEKNQYINLVHINPQGFQQTKETYKENKFIKKVTFIYYCIRFFKERRISTCPRARRPRRRKRSLN